MSAFTPVRGKLNSPFTSGPSGCRIAVEMAYRLHALFGQFRKEKNLRDAGLIRRTPHPPKQFLAGQRHRVAPAVGKKQGEKKMNGEMSRSGSTEEAAHTTTKVFRDLTVYGDPEVLDALIPGIESRLADGWYRDRESEQGLPSDGGQSQFFLFARRASDARPAVALAMCAEGRRLSVTNVMPDDDDRLSCAQYNAILLEFYLKFLHPAASEAGLTVELSSDERSFEREYGWQGVRVLKRFSVIANKSSTHPADLRRWMDFLIYLHHRPNRDYDFGLLAKWLIEDGWSAEKAHRLISECEFARDLFRAYDENMSEISAGDRATNDQAG